MGKWSSEPPPAVNVFWGALVSRIICSIIDIYAPSPWGTLVSEKRNTYPANSARRARGGARRAAAGAIPFERDVPQHHTFSVCPRPRFYRENKQSHERANPQQTRSAKNAKLRLHAMQELPRRARLLGRKVPLCLPFPNTSEGDVVAACEHRQSDGCDEQRAVLYTLPARSGRHRHVGAGIGDRGCGASLGMRPYWN